MNFDQKTFGDLKFNPMMARLYSSKTGEEVSLTITEFRIFMALATNMNKEISRSFIASAVWNGHIVNGRAMDTHISTIRKKIINHGLRIAPCYRSGYMMLDVKDGIN